MWAMIERPIVCQCLTIENFYPDLPGFSPRGHIPLVCHPQQSSAKTDTNPRTLSSIKTFCLRHTRVSSLTHLLPSFQKPSPGSSPSTSPSTILMPPFPDLQRPRNPVLSSLRGDGPVLLLTTDSDPTGSQRWEQHVSPTVEQRSCSLAKHIKFRVK